MGAMKKKPKMVSIPEDGRVDEETYHELFSHAKNSSLFYAQASMKSEAEIRGKLRDKGYVDDDLTVSREDKITGEVSEYTVNIIDDTVEHLQSMILLDDDKLAEGIVESMLRRGKGEREISRKMFEKKIPDEIRQNHLDSITEDSEEVLEALQSATDKYRRKSAYRREEDPRKRNQKLYTFLITRGFSTHQINEHLEELEEDDDDF